MWDFGLTIDFHPPWNHSLRIGVPYAACSPENQMNSIIYIVGLVVIVVAILGFIGLR